MLINLIKNKWWKIFAFLKWNSKILRHASTLAICHIIKRRNNNLHIFMFSNPKGPGSIPAWANHSTGFLRIIFPFYTMIIGKISLDNPVRSLNDWMFHYVLISVIKVCTFLPQAKNIIWSMLPDRREPLPHLQYASTLMYVAVQWFHHLLDKNLACIFFWSVA